MNKKIYLLFTLFLVGTTLFLSSCLNNNNDDDIDQDWYDYQNALFQDIAKDPTYKQLQSETNDGSVYWQPSTVITDSDIMQRETAQGKPEFTDTVVVRYEGWYYEIGSKTPKIFDSTESPSLSNSLNPNKVERQFAVSGVVDGWSTLLQDMTVGEERLVVIPQQLGYGSSKTTYIPAYTTLWFRVKLFKIIPMAGRK